jgi:hypothetical protein
MRTSKIRKYLTSSKFLINGSIVIAVIWLFGGMAILKLYFHGNIPERYLYLCGLLSLPWLILSSLFAIIRRELPRTGNLPSFTGWFAVVVGIIALGMTSFGFIILLVNLIDIW